MSLLLVVCAYSMKEARILHVAKSREKLSFLVRAIVASHRRPSESAAPLFTLALSRNLRLSIRYANSNLLELSRIVNDCETLPKSQLRNKTVGEGGAGNITKKRR